MTDILGLRSGPTRIELPVGENGACVYMRPYTGADLVRLGDEPRLGLMIAAAICDEHGERVYGLDDATIDAIEQLDASLLNFLTSAIERVNPSFDDVSKK